MKRVIQAFALLLFVLLFAAGLRPESSVYDIDGFGFDVMFLVPVCKAAALRL